MGWVESNGVFYGDRPYRSLGREVGDATVFDAYAIRNAPPTDYAEIFAYAEMRRRLRLICASVERFRRHPMQLVTALDLIVPGLAMRPTRYVLAVIDHELGHASAGSDVMLRAARLAVLIEDQHEHRREHTFYREAAE